MSIPIPRPHPRPPDPALDLLGTAEAYSRLSMGHTCRNNPLSFVDELGLLAGLFC